MGPEAYEGFYCECGARVKVKRDGYEVVNE